MLLARPRAILAVLMLAAAAAGILIAQWGTGWTIPQVSASGAGYALHETWNAAASPGGALQRPIGIAVAPDGDVYVTDASPRVVRFGRSGEVRNQWGREGDGPGEFGNPVGLAVGPDGAVYVSDYEQDRIQKFSPDGEFLQEFGQPGTAPGELDAPAALEIDETGFIYVADFYNHRVQRFRPDGRLEAVIGHPGRVGPGALHYPTGVDITPEGELLVADAYNYQIQWFTTRGEPVRRVGYHVFWLWPRTTRGAGGFAVPTDAAAGPDGLIHVADSGSHRVVMLSASGAYLAEWRIPDPNPKIYSPEHLALSPDGSTVYATDLARNRVLVLSVE